MTGVETGDPGLRPRLHGLRTPIRRGLLAFPAFLESHYPPPESSHCRLINLSCIIFPITLSNYFLINFPHACFRKGIPKFY